MFEGERCYNVTTNGKKKGFIPCGAKTRKGTPCPKPPAGPSGRCHYHGGSTPRGVAAPNYKHGKYSKYAMSLPERYRSAYYRSIDDKKTIELSQQIALVEAREVELVERLTPETSTALWHDAQRSLDSMRAAYEMSPDDPKKEIAAQRAFEALTEAVRRGVSNEDTWALLLNTLEMRRRLADTERKRIESLQDRPSREELAAFAGALFGSVRRHISDRSISDNVALMRIAGDFERVMSANDVIDAEEVKNEAITAGGESNGGNDE